MSNPYDMNADWGLATYDVRNIGAISAVYTLPFGQGQGHLPMTCQGLAERPGERLVSEQHRYDAVRIPVYAAAQLQPFQQRRYSQPCRPFVNPDFTGSVIIGKPSQWFNPTPFWRLPPTAASMAISAGIL